jgi:hypothetical protein
MPGFVRIQRMSNPEDHHGASRRPSWREERLREQIVQTLVERCKLDSTAEVVLREIVSQCSVGGEIGGRFTFQLPAAIGLDQQIKIARPLRELLQKRREDVARQLERIEGVGSNMAKIVRHAIANPLVIVAGKSPLDGYLRICRESAMHWGIVRALQHLRDALTATNETFFSNPSRHSFTWRLNLDRITPAMLHRVERCLRDVDPRAIHDAACNQWLKNLQLFFDQVKAGTFQLPARPRPRLRGRRRKWRVRRRRPRLRPPQRPAACSSRRRGLATDCGGCANASCRSTSSWRRKTLPRSADRNPGSGILPNVWGRRSSGFASTA